MPIILHTPIRVLSQQEFHELNHQVLGVIFQVHNEYGRLADEAVFKSAIAAEWSRTGIAAREVPVRLTHGSYSKTLYMDLLFESSLMIEAKTADRLSGPHRAQALNYLFLTGMHHGTLVNLRTPRVEHEFVSTHISPEARRVIQVRKFHWPEDEDSARLLTCAESLLRDWGSHLEVSLYREAVAHLLQLGEPSPVSVFHDGQRIGDQPMLLLNETTVLACTALTGGHAEMLSHLQRLLSHTKLTSLRWLNFNHTTLELRALPA